MADTHAPVLEHAHPPDLQHHFDDMHQQFDSATLGMWVFLLTEIMFFGGMFAAYTIYRGMYPEAFASTSKHMATWLGAVNTAVLICSSLTMALAVRSAQLGQRTLFVGPAAGHLSPGRAEIRITAKGKSGFVDELKRFGAERLLLQSALIVSALMPLGTLGRSRFTIFPSVQTA